MSGSLKRALWLWVAEQIEGLHVFANDLANTQKQYPACTVTEISHDIFPLGCGKKDYSVRDQETNALTHVGKMHQAQTIYRLTITAPDMEDVPGQERVDGLIEGLEALVLDTKLMDGSVVMTDTETDPPETFHIEAIHQVSRQHIPADITGEPFLYRGSLSIRLDYLKPITKPVTHVVKRVQIREASNGEE